MDEEEHEEEEEVTPEPRNLFNDEYYANLKYDLKANIFEENDNINDVDGKEIDENKINKIIKDENKLPEDKKPPNLEKLKKKGKEKVEINLFN